MNRQDLELMIGPNERIMWRGKPDKKCFILESIFNPMLPFALIWAFIDFFVIGIILFANINTLAEASIFIIPFFLLHLMPVWLYIGGVFFSFRRYKNTSYIITDKGIYVSGGLFSYTYDMKPFTDLSHINIHRGIFDQQLGVGDVISDCSHNASMSGTGSSSHSHSGITIRDIREYQEVFQLLKKLQTDVYADTMYPNQYRPANNPGYNTQYNPVNGNNNPYNGYPNNMGTYNPYQNSNIDRNY